MLEASPQSRTLRFGPYEADLSTGELRRDGSKISLQDKPFQILALLLQHSGELVTREELRTRLWPADTFVDFENGLNTAVKKLRHALDDSAEEPRYVETLPKRGYRFLGPITPEGVPGAHDESQGQPTPRERRSTPGPDLATQGAPVRAGPRRSRWRLHAAWLAAVIAAAVLSPRLGPGDRDAAPPPNRLPVIVLMDSPLPGRVYDPRTLAAGGTNADDLTDALRDLPVAIEKENTSPMWHREAQVLQQNPDLIVSHLSCLFDQRVAPAGDPALRQFFDLAVDRLVSFFAYVAANNPRTRFLIYSRGRFEHYGGSDKFIKDSEARFPVLQGRLYAWTVPGPHDKATFRDPNLARLIRERVKAALRLP
jgi:DNA-binding winged helix-turn-helix (wHTH) protein